METGAHIYLAVIVNVFSPKHKTTAGSGAMAHHIDSFNEFMTIKCDGKVNLEKYLMQHVINTNEWKSLIKNTMNIVEKLNNKQTVIQFIRSNKSLRNSFQNNSERHRLLGMKNMESEVVIRQARLEEQLHTEIHRM